MLTFYIKVIKYFLEDDMMNKTIKNYCSDLNKGIKTMFKEFFNKDTNKKQRANMWTFSRLVTSFLIPICSIISIFTGNIALFTASIGITAFGGISDFFDGRSARKHNSYSEFGKFLDQLADKVFSIMVGINLSLFNPLFLINLFGEIGIAGINAYYKIKNPDLNMKSSQIGRLKQWPLFLSLVLGFISVLAPSFSVITNSSILITFALQILTAGSYISENNEKIKKLKIKQEIESIELGEKIKEKEKTKDLEKVNNTNSRIEQYKKLRDLLNEIIDNKENLNNIDKINYEKIKK